MRIAKVMVALALIQPVTRDDLISRPDCPPGCYFDISHAGCFCPPDDCGERNDVVPGRLDWRAWLRGIFEKGGASE